MAATHVVQRVTVQGPWVARKGDVAKLRVVGVSKVPEVTRALTLMGLTPSLHS